MDRLVRRMVRDHPEVLPNGRVRWSGAALADSAGKSRRNVPHGCRRTAHGITVVGT